MFLDSTDGAEEDGAAEASLAGGALSLLPLGRPLLGSSAVGCVAGGGRNAGSAGNSSDDDNDGGG